MNSMRVFLSCVLAFFAIPILPSTRPPVSVHVDQESDPAPVLPRYSPLQTQFHRELANLAGVRFRGILHFQLPLALRVLTQ